MALGAKLKGTVSCYRSNKEYVDALSVTQTSLQ